MVKSNGGTAAALLARGAARLAAAGISEAGLNCAWLLARALGTDRLSLLAGAARPVPPGAAREFKKLLARKAQGEPLAYILGSQPFCGLSLKVDPRVLVPRPETEELVELAAGFIAGNYPAGAAGILDFGTGCGAIALALAVRFPEASVTAAEKSKEALACATENAGLLGLGKRVKFVRASSLRGPKGPFDVIVSNPPYIPTGVIGGLDKEVLSEPFIALDGGRNGLKVAASIISRAPEALKKGGALFLELGEAQGPQALGLFGGRFWREKKLFRDLNGRKRFLRAVKK